MGMIIDGVRTYCGLCGDSGAVTIWHPLTLSSLRRQDSPVALRECNVACKCRRGSSYTQKLRHRESVRWLDRFGDKEWHCRRTVRGRNEHGSIFDAAADVAEHGSDKLKRFIGGVVSSNYVEAFDEF